jgi:hypothetical protein
MYQISLKLFPFPALSSLGTHSDTFELYCQGESIKSAVFWESVFCIISTGKELGLSPLEFFRRYKGIK